ncbi:leucine-rich repeat receptor-like serine/threonine-protein kinase BAM1-like [Hibiscus syriacus]|uniref:Leucine-rich repeat receptor-like serine/threonine-protein kinase BAM1-like n=1 Tax=Hibiscus syriacus TaxID=106335 RepID=A0A6A2X538_HIBSY|nr:leucine-rich repeat receptor-like serine/threonine-protein kinase BAM1-like [Hibiscus syriacus]
MAIFEHLFWSNPAFSSPGQITNGALGSGSLGKLGNQERVWTAYASDGEQYLTHIAQPAPLPCIARGKASNTPSKKHHQGCIFILSTPAQFLCIYCIIQ